MFVAAQIFGIFIIITNVISMQMQNKKNIILFFILANSFSAINFFLLKSFSGSIICLFAILQALINRHYENVKEIPKWLVVIYICISIVLGLLTLKKYIDIIPIICSIIYTVTIIQKQEVKIRNFALLNNILWLIYDIIYKAYTASISDIFMIISALAGMYRFDLKKQKIKQS